MVVVDYFVQHVGRSANASWMNFVDSNQLLGRVVSASPAHDVADDAEIAAAVTGSVRCGRSRHNVAAADQQDDPNGENSDLHYNNGRRKQSIDWWFFFFVFLIFFFVNGRTKRGPFFFSFCVFCFGIFKETDSIPASLIFSDKDFFAWNEDWWLSL